MISRVYSLFDSKALNYSPPFLAGTDGLAVRMVGDLVADINTTVGRHPADFRLYCIGTFDDQKAVMTGLIPPSHVVDAQSLVSIEKRLPIDADQKESA